MAADAQAAAPISLSTSRALRWSWPGRRLPGAGRPVLADAVWRQRHRLIVLVAFAHLPVLWTLGMVGGEALAHVWVETLVIAGLAAAAAAGRLGRRARSLAAMLSLLSSSAVLVHVSGGLIEAHFHFFVVMSIVLLYHDWAVSASAFGFVLLHHGVLGALDAARVYDHAAAWERPWLWAGIHAAFIAANCAAGIVSWRANEREQARAESYAATMSQQAAELERAGNAKSEFFSRLSHEIRTPMTAVLGFGQLLEHDPQLPAETRAHAATIVASGRHLLGLIDELLDLSRAEAGHLQLAPTAVPLSDALAEAVAIIRPLADARDLTVELTPTSGDVEVLADPQRLRQVLLNLLSNAVKYNRDGGQITVAVRADADTVTIEVTDTGAGIAPDDLDRLFVAFERLEPTVATPGTGLGLAISRRIVEAMGGQITVASRPDVGSTFGISLPSAPLAGTAAPAGSPVPASSSGSCSNAPCPDRPGDVPAWLTTRLSSGV